jgi:hypothetical protein
MEQLLGSPRSKPKRNRVLVPTVIRISENTRAGGMLEWCVPVSSFRFSSRRDQLTHMIIFIVAIHVLWKVQNVDFRIQVVGFVSHDNMHHSDSNN